LGRCRQTGQTAFSTSCAAFLGDFLAAFLIVFLGLVAFFAAGFLAAGFFLAGAFFLAAAGFFAPDACERQGERRPRQWPTLRPGGGRQHAGGRRAFFAAGFLAAPLAAVAPNLAFSASESAFHAAPSFLPTCEVRGSTCVQGRAVRRGAR
jgi:hypothetical protein